MTTPYIISTPPIPVGAISYYIPNGTTAGFKNPADPNGWVICDGQTRNAPNGDERYAALAPLLLTYLGGTQNANTITPPDFRSRFLYGQASTANNTMNASSIYNSYLKEANIPGFNVTLSEVVHSHDISCTNLDINNDTYSTQGGIFTSVTTYTSTLAQNYLFIFKNTQNQGALPDPPKASVTYVIKY
jgi:microcystin-dependent protein